MKSRYSLLAHKLDLNSNKAFDLTIEVIFTLFRETRGLCKITNVPLDILFSQPRSMFNPSLDRIDSRLGYTIENVQFISLGANLMKSQDNTNEECITFYR